MKSFFAHNTAVIDEGAAIGSKTKIWHFSHIMESCKIGKHCNIGQNVVVSPGVMLGNNVKVQNNVSIYLLRTPPRFSSATRPLYFPQLLRYPFGRDYSATPIPLRREGKLIELLPRHQ